jgi:hypothetical protein
MMGLKPETLHFCFKSSIQDTSFDGHGLGKRDNAFHIGSFACT